MDSKRILIVFSAVAVLIGSSCKKDSVSSATGTTTTADETTTVAATISNTGTYTYTLPSGNYSVTTPAAHAIASDLAVSNTGTAAFTYIPVADFTGTDTVIVSPADTMGMPGGCRHHDSTASRKIAFHITVTASK